MSLKKKTSKWQKIVVLSIVCVLLGGFILAFLGVGTEGVSKVLTKTEAQTLVDNTLSKIPNKISLGAMFVFENIDVVVNEVEEGNEKNLIFKCNYSTLDVQNTLEPKLDEVFTNVYDMYLTNDALGKKTNATKVNIFVSQDISNILSSAKVLEGEIDLCAYEVNEGEFSLYLDDYTVNTITGGIINTVETIKATKIVKYNGESVNISGLTTLRTGVSDSIGLNNYNSEKPYTGNAIQKFVAEFKYDFHRNFIQDNRWVYLIEGLGTTLAITGLSALLGIVLGFLIAIVRCTHQTTGKLSFIDKICGFYLTITRGTPVMVQLLIIYFVILLPIGIPKFLAAVICFGLNSGAYVAEIVRGGIMSVDIGQMEAGRSLGFNYAQTMVHFIVPQAFKAVLPSLANEFITLLKESSVAFYIGVADLTQGGLKIRSLTFSNFLPLIAVALIYLVLVLILSYLVGLLERRLRKSDR